jgi:T5SS/PEP-CTERM-associated repeat protein
MKFIQHTSNCCACLIVLLLSAATPASTDVWFTNASGNYSDGANWSIGVPGISDNAIYGVGSGATFTVTFPGQPIFQGTKNYASGGASFGPSNITFAPSTQIFLGPSTYTVPSIVIGGTLASPAILNTTLQGLSTGTATIGLGANSPATLNVNAGTFSVTSSASDYELIVGNDASGSALNVTGGAQVSLTGAEGNAVIGKSAGVTGTANVSGAGTAWSSAANDAAAPLAVGGFGNGALNITGGGAVNDFAADIARETGSNGSVTVGGAGSIWSNRGPLVVGSGGTGLLTVSSGAQVSDDSLVVGDSGNGTLTISGGGVVRDGSALVGSAPTATGTVNVNGGGSKWTQVSDLTVGGIVTSNGQTASGTVHITGGGQVNTGGNANIGSGSNPLVRVEDNGSQWNVNGATKIGDSGSLIVAAGAAARTNIATVSGSVLIDETGAAWTINDYLALTGTVCLGVGCTTPAASVSVGDGAHVNMRVAQVGTQFGASQVFVDGAGSTWSTAEQLYVGLGGGATFMVTGGAIVTSGTTEIGVSPTANGAVSVNASTWTNNGDFTVGVVGKGKLTVSFGGVVSAGGLFTVGPQGTVEGNAHVAATVRNRGIVAPGIAVPITSNTVGALDIDGDYTQFVGGALDIELGSTASFDKLIVTGHATLAGTLNVSLFNAFTPAVGNSFDLLTATGGITGNFSQVDLPSLLTGGHGPFWTVVYTNTDVILKLVNSPTGDFNHNGVVDAADYTVWRKSLGQTGIGLAADGDGNHVIDMADYNIWKSNFGLAAGSAAAASNAVLEPATVWMVLAGTLTICCQRRSEISQARASVRRAVIRPVLRRATILSISYV